MEKVFSAKLATKLFPQMLSLEIAMGYTQRKGAKVKWSILLYLTHSSAWNCPLFFDRSSVLHPSKRLCLIQGLSWFSAGRSPFLLRCS